MPNRLADSFIPDKVDEFNRSLVYAKDAYLDTLTMVLAISHARDVFSTVPLTLATSDQPASGKSTIACDIPMMLAYAPWKVGRQSTPDSIRNKYLERIRPNLVCDDVGKIFGDSGMNGRNTVIYAILIDCYRRAGTASMSRNGVSMDVPVFGPAFMNGLKNAVPNDLFTRAIWFQMEEAPSGLDLRDALDDSVQADGKILAEALHSWAGQHAEEMRQFMRHQVRFIHPKLEKRKRQLWGPVFAAAYAAGGDWPRRIYDAFVSIALDADEKPVPVPEQFALLDTAEILVRRGVTSILTADLLDLLRLQADSAYYREATDEHLIKSVLPAALGPSARITTTALTGLHAGSRGSGKGWQAKPILLAAAALHEVLYPPMEAIEDDTEAELVFEPCPVLATATNLKGA
jgi:hypothetical protein